MTVFHIDNIETMENTENQIEKNTTCGISIKYDKMHIGKYGSII